MVDVDFGIVGVFVGDVVEVCVFGYVDFKYCV